MRGFYRDGQWVVRSENHGFRVWARMTGEINPGVLRLDAAFTFECTTGIQILHCIRDPKQCPAAALEGGGLAHQPPESLCLFVALSSFIPLRFVCGGEVRMR